MTDTGWMVIVGIVFIVYIAIYLGVRRAGKPYRDAQLMVIENLRTSREERTKAIETITLKKGHAIAFDFDGVIHKYSKGWQDGSIYDEANMKVVWLIKLLRATGYPCVIISTRDSQQIKEWWDEHADEMFGMKAELVDEDTTFFNDLSYVGITNRKLPAQVYVDDRAYKYTGQNTAEFIRDFMWEETE